MGEPRHLGRRGRAFRAGPGEDALEVERLPHETGTCVAQSRKYARDIVANVERVDETGRVESVPEALDRRPSMRRRQDGRARCRRQPAAARGACSSFRPAPGVRALDVQHEKVDGRELSARAELRVRDSSARCNCDRYKPMLSDTPGAASCAAASRCCKSAPKTGWITDVNSWVPATFAERRR
jgi:hypothetical protein